MAGASDNAVLYEKRKIFVRGLPITTEKEEVEELFQEVGKVTEVSIRKPKNTDAIVNLVFFLAFVSFAEESSVFKAISKFNRCEFINKKGDKGFLTIEQAKLQSQSHEMAYLHMKQERESMLKEIEDNDWKLKMTENNCLVDDDMVELSEKERRLEKELKEEQEKVDSLKSQVEVLELKLKLKKMEVANEQLSNQLT